MALGACAYFWAALTTEGVGSKTMFVPGATTDGHYQIETACSSCHTPFEGVTNEACLACHGEELRAADDSHPRSKFTDPRNADLVEQLDATRCVTCHEEHAPGMTRPMGVTLPDDYCYTCHADVGRERPSHDGMAFDTCASAGCHNYHDNTALYEDFLKAHASDAPLAPQPLVPAHTALALRERAPAKAMAHLAGDAPPDRRVNPALMAEWERTTHARAGVNCTACHSAAGLDSGDWIDAPGERECASCHGTEAAGFLQGRHGMRLNAGLSRMTPALARRPMKQAALEHELSCTSCHAAHTFETRRAAVDACLGCHDDRHSQAYVGSPHHALWVREGEGLAAAGSGVSCATCHLPREQQRESGADVVIVQHNQNLNLRPNEKMARSVCLTCHGLGFSLGALADTRLIASNFSGRPVRSVPGIEMAARRARRGSN
jgi:predicted CXXCH cytochrome family protein